jgi:hypothetical protein
MSDKLATFVLLADPQQGNPDEKGRLERCSKLNVALNKLPRTSWPPPNENSLITCTGLIDPKATFIAGDLTQFGGLTNSNEQDHTNQYNPSNYVGGKQLEYLRALYDGWKGMNGVEQLGSYGPIYLGLGNHGKARASQPLTGY